MSKALPRFDLDRYLPYRLTVAAARLSADLEKQYRTQYGISIPEWRILLNLGYAGDVSVRDIEKRVSLEKSKVSRAATKLEAKGYITKQVDAADRRLLKMALTAEGAEILRKLIPIAKKYEKKLDQLLGDQADALHAALDSLMDEEDAG